MDRKLTRIYLNDHVALLALMADVAERSAIALRGTFRDVGHERQQSDVIIQVDPRELPVHPLLLPRQISRSSPASPAFSRTSAAAATSCTPTPVRSATVRSSSEVLPERRPA